MESKNPEAIEPMASTTIGPHIKTELSCGWEPSFQRRAPAKVSTTTRVI